jgi:hypothetical protein
MKKIFTLISILVSSQLFAFGGNTPTSLRINPYSDSVKIVNLLSYYVNVEGIYEGRILPVNESDIVINTTYGRAEGMNIFFPNSATPPDSFEVSAYWKTEKRISAKCVLYVQKINPDWNPNTNTIIVADSAAQAPTPIPTAKKKKKKK